MSVREINLHPSSHPLASLASKVYDVIVIGSGPPRRAVAARASANGFKALIVENELFGGDCPFWACIPSKALLRLFEALEAARAVGGARELISNERSVDVKSVLARRDPCSRESGTIHLS
jgi:pyruvate/2-oxoglutarate dehydrogenase complex dihydrolipoamide dehydrogenase (E3) component